MLEQIEALATQVQTLGEGEGILDGQAHVGHAELSLYRTVLKLHGTMYNRLWMDEYLYLFSINAKQPFGLNHLEALVHHRG